MTQPQAAADEGLTYEQALALFDARLRALEDDRLGLEEAVAAVDEARRLGHQPAIIGDRGQTEAHLDHPRGIAGGPVMDARELAMLFARRQQMATSISFLLDRRCFYISRIRFVLDCYGLHRDGSRIIFCGQNPEVCQIFWQPSSKNHLSMGIAQCASDMFREDVLNALIASFRAYERCKRMLIERQMVCNETSNFERRRWIEIGEHNNYIARRRKHRENAISTQRAATVAKASRAATVAKASRAARRGLLFESIGIFRPSPTVPIGPRRLFARPSSIFIRVHSGFAHSYRLVQCMNPPRPFVCLKFREV